MKKLMEGFDSILSLKFGTYFGVPLRAHWSWTLFMLFIIPNGNMFGITLAVFFFVILHEYGHVLAAKSQGIPTDNVTIYPIGGVASIDMAPNKPKQEFIVTVAGPLVNVILVLISLPFWFLFTYLDWSTAATMAVGAGAINFCLAAFNVIPAWPMDGGRILRSILASMMNYRTATLLAVRCSQVTCLLMLIPAVYFGNILMVFIMPIIALAAQAELVRVQNHESFLKLRPIIRQAREGKYVEAGLEAIRSFDDEGRVKAVRLVELLRASGHPEIADPLLLVLDKEYPQAQEVRDAWVEAEITCLRKMSADVDAVLTAVEERKSFEEIEEIVENLTDEDFKAHCRTLLGDLKNRRPTG